MNFIIFGLLPMLLLSARNITGVIGFVLYMLLLFRIYGEDVATANVVVYSLLIVAASFAIWILSLFFRRW